METSSLFEYEYDFPRYIETQIQQIADLQERKLANQVLKECLLKIMQQSEKYYKALEERVYNEIESCGQGYEIYTTIVSREDYEPINPFLFPVLKEDLQPNSFTCEEIQEQLKEHQKVEFGQAFFDGSYRDLKVFLEQNLTFPGKLLLGEKTISATFSLTMDQRYMKRVENLYQLFLANRIPWTTVNTAFMSKMLQICLIKADLSLSEEKATAQYKVDFGSWAKQIKIGYVPLWNVDASLVESADFMVPCVDAAGWEHRISTEEMGEENHYLLQVTDEIMHYQYTKNSIIVTTQEQTLPPIYLYKIASRTEDIPLRYEAPILSNAKKDSFVKRYTEHTAANLQTTAELYRKVCELNFSAYLEFLGAELKMEKHQNSYTMNPFIKDELINPNAQRILLFKFHAKNEQDPLNEDMMSFVVSQLQLSFHEYLCEGILE